MTVSDGAGSLAKGQISDKKNHMVAASVSTCTHPRKLWISLLLQCLPVPLASYSVVFSSGRPTVQELLQVEVDKKPHSLSVSRNLNESQLNARKVWHTRKPSFSTFSVIYMYIAVHKIFISKYFVIY